MLLNIFEDFILKSSQNVLNTIFCIESARKETIRAQHCRRYCIDLLAAGLMDIR